MTRQMTTEVGGVQLDDGTYELECVGLEDCTLNQSAYGKGENVPGVKFIFHVAGMENAEGNPIELSAIATAERLTPRTKLYRWGNALGLGLKEPGQTANLDAMIGHRAMGVIVNKPDADGQIWARIEDVVALPTTVKRAMTTEPSPGEPDASEPSPQSSPGPPVDPWEGFRAVNGDVDWNIFSAYLKKEGVQPGDIADYLGVPKADPATIREWAEGGAGRTAQGLILETARYKREKQEDPAELPS